MRPMLEHSHLGVFPKAHSYLRRFLLTIISNTSLQTCVPFSCDLALPTMRVLRSFVGAVASPDEPVYYSCFVYALAVDWRIGTVPCVLGRGADGGRGDR